MITIKSILSPVDFSEASRRALEQAIALARWCSAELVVLHVVPSVPSSPDAFLTAPAPPPLAPVERRRLLETLARFAEPAEESGVPLRLVVDEGFTVERILANADANGSSLIVIGTHGAGGFSRLVLGSVAEKVLRLAKCPVLTVPAEGSAADAGVLFKTVIAAVDFSEASRTALLFALALASEAKAHLVLVHVLESLPADDPRALLHFGSDEYRSFLEGDARERVLALLPQDAPPEAPPEIVIAAGKPYREILRVAAAREAGFIVMGVHGRGAHDRTLFGSIANHVVRGAACPVLTMRPALPPAPLGREKLEAVTA